MIETIPPSPPAFDRGRTLIDVLRGHATSHPDRPFLTWLADGDHIEAELSFGALDARVRRVAAALVDAGIDAGDRALLLYPQGPDFLIAFLACLWAGVVAVPAYPPRNQRHMPRIESILADAGARMILSVDEARDRIAGWLAGRPGAPTAFLATDALDQGDRDVPVRADPDGVAFLQYTSGSTGQPKGVIVTHANILVNMRMIRDSFGHDASSHVASWLPAYHDMGLIGNLLQPLYLGSRLVLMPPAAFLQKPVRWLRAVSQFRIRTTGAPNFAFDLAARTVSAEQKVGLDLSSLDLLYNGSEPVDAAVLDRFVAAFAACGFRPSALYPCFGMAETTLLATGGPHGRGARALALDSDALADRRVRIAAPDAERPRRLVSCGRSVRDQELVIVDPENGHPVTDEAVGEVWLRGPHVARGYWGREALTQETFGARLANGAGPFLRTGDLGFVRDGELFVAGRLKDVIIIRGRNYYPQDIERALAECHPAIAGGASAAFGVEMDAEERLAVVMEVQRSAVRDLDADGVRDAALTAIAEAFDLRASVVVLVKPLGVPKTSSGKVQRRECRDRWRKGELDVLASWTAGTAVAPASAPDRVPGAEQPDRVPGVEEIVRWVRRAIATEVGRPEASIDPQASFSSHGLDSVTLVRLSGALSDWLQRALPPTSMYDYPSIARLAAHVAGADHGPDARRSEASAHEPVAIVGMGCRLPGGVGDVEAFWRLLAGGVDAITEVPGDRWDADALFDPDPSAPGRMSTRYGGFLDRVDAFDAQFFGIAPREAAAMDPQHRLLLEVSWHALEQAGIAPSALADSSTGVFFGISTHDYARQQLLARPADVDMYSGVGNAFSAASGRWSYLLGLRGPSLSIDTACSSSLVAVHLAVQSLRRGECDVACAGGVNVILAPELTIAFSKAGMMAPDGRCKAFDASADGYVRSEGCGVVVLKRLRDAVAAGDRVVAVIRGTAVNQDGRSNGLTAPNGPAQEQVIRRALDDGGVAPADIDYVEAHGTGTALGDPIEVQALASALGAGRSVPLLLGSVKTNVGHLEAAAGVAGLIKAALAVERGEIPASLHFRTPNEHLDWSALPVRVAARTTAWPARDQVRRAGVSAFGFTGTNAHVVLEQAPAAALPAESTPKPRSAHVLAISARDEDSLRQLIAAYRRILEEDAAGADLEDICQTAGAGRSHFPWRVAVSASTREEMAAALGLATPVCVDAANPVRLAWLFTGQGSQYVGMGRELYASEPVFRGAFDRCDAVVHGLRGVSLRPLVFEDDRPAGARAIDRTEWTQPALFAVEYALAALWQSWGLAPFVVMGHSIGELVAATVAGVFDVEDGMRLAVERGRLMQALPEGGAMLAVFAPERAAAELAASEALVGVAATNAPDETVLSGDAAALTRIEARLAAAGLRTQFLNVSHAFHSPLMAPMADAFAEVLGAVRFAAPSVPIVSNVTGRVAGDEVAGRGYWRTHVTAPVRFVESLGALATLGVTHVVEMGPAPILSALGARGWRGGPVVWLPSLRRRISPTRSMMSALAALYTAGATVDWAGLGQGRPHRRVTLPTYPFRRDRFWVTPSTPLATGPSLSAGVPAHPVLGVRLPEIATMPGTVSWQVEIATTRAPWREYRIDGVASPPLGAYVRLAREAAHELLGEPASLSRLELVGVGEPQAVSADSLQVVATPAGREGADCRVFLRAGPDGEWKLAAIATAHRGPVSARVNERRPLDFGVMFFNGSEERSGRHHYRVVLDAARYADRHGFSSVWAPERHYTAFGGLYPNPSVLHAALARETRHLRLMAGSLVTSLHHPLRAAEDWALVDNLSNGRVGVSLASGWNPADFAMAPQKYAGRREEVFDQLDTLRRLWRGEAVPATAGDGRPIEVRTYPTPVQPEFPAWITAAGNPETFARAGASGAHLLTHLLDQDVDELTAKIGIYREARARAGHDPGSGRVVVMVHTFIGDDLDVVREQVRAPYCAYIKANIGLLKGLAYSRGSEVDLSALSPRDLDEFVGFLYERFSATRALIGTPESCAPLAERLYRGGVDELACLVDFGPSTSEVLGGLPHLTRLKDRIRDRARSDRTNAVTEFEAIDAIRSQCDAAIDGQDFYRRLAARGVEFGVSLQVVERFDRRDGEALAQLRQATTDPAVALDAGLQAFVAALPAAAFVDASDGVYLPSDARGISVHDSSVPVAWAHALVTSDARRGHDRFSGRITLLASDGRVVAEIERLVADRVQTGSPVRPSADDPAGWVYAIRWDARPTAATGIVPAGHWVVFADRGGVGARLAAVLAAEGRTVALVAPGATSPLDVQAIADVVSREAARGDLAGIVSLWPLDAGTAEETTAATIALGETLGVAGTVHLVQALAALPQQTTRLWVVTRAAEVVVAADRPALAQSPVWGLGRVVAADRPELWGGLLDLPPDADLDRDAVAVRDELAATDDEGQVAWRAGVRLVPRLVPAPLTEDTAPAFDSAATYLITGGLGGLGRRVAHWMVRHGARDLVLTALTPLPPEAEWNHLPASIDARVAERIAAVRSLQAQGASVRVVTADAASPDEMGMVFETMTRSGRPLRGVVHLAGRPENQPVTDVDYARDRILLAPKIAGTWVLHELTAGLPLDFFVMFSSISSIWGSRGQPLYAAANHFLDVMTAHRRAAGLPALTASWGPWSEGGMVDRSGLETLARMGVAPLGPDAATSVLGRLLGADVPHRVVANVDWGVFTELFQARRRHTLFDLLDVSRPGGGLGGVATEFRRGLDALPAAERQQHLADHVHREVAAVLGWRASELPDPRIGFFDLGMDSLTALELKNRLQAALGVPLRATVIFNHPSVTALAGYLDSLLAPAGGTEEATVETEELAALGEDELARLLDEQIGAIEKAAD